MEMTAVKLKYLFVLLQCEEHEYTVSSLAKVFGVAKSTVSRTLDAFREEGLVRTDVLRLTEYGRKLGEQYLKERELITQWLMSEQHSSYEVAKEDAVHFLIAVSQKTKDVFLQKAAYAVMCKKMEETKHLDGSAVAKILGDGTYSLPFTFYREKQGKHNFISMANRGFYHPATLIIKNGIGMIHLRGKTIEETSLLGFILKGKLATLKYMSNHQYQKAGQDQDQFFFPLDALDFHYEKEEKRLQGNIKLRMGCTVGCMHMPESTATLIVQMR